VRSLKPSALQSSILTADRPGIAGSLFLGLLVSTHCGRQPSQMAVPAFVDQKTLLAANQQFRNTQQQQLFYGP